MMRSKIGKTTTIDVTLSKTGQEGAGIFHDIRYTNDNYGGNQNEITFEITNVSGNSIEIVDIEDYPRSPYGGARQCKCIKLRICGTLEGHDFLEALKMILEAERMNAIIDPGYGG